MANSGAAAAMASLLPPHAVQLFIVSVSTYWAGIKPFTGAEPTLFLWLFRPDRSTRRTRNRTGTRDNVTAGNRMKRKPRGDA
jgi:hypothetical protein